MNEAIARTSEPRLAGVVTLLDKVFPLVWVGFYLLLPMSGWASEMFASWFDQRRDLEALRALLADGRADAIAENVIGPAYIGAAALVHQVLGLSLEDSLVAVTRTSYVLGVALGLVLVRVLVGRLVQASPSISLASQVVFVALVFAAGTWYWSDVPWSHFLAAALAVAVYVARFAPATPTAISAAAVGALLALLAATRTFEALAVVLAWALVATALLLLRSGSGVELRRLLVGTGAFVATTAVVYLATGKRELFLLYENHLDRQSGSVSGAEIAETPTSSLGLVPTKLVQLFLDPCYRSLCETSDYETGGGSGSNLDLWSLPLAVQLPALVLLPVCVIAVAVVFVRSARRDDVRMAATRPLAEMTVAAAGLVLGYAGSTLTGPSHLRYGFARDFMLPALVTGVVAVVLGSWLAWSLVGRRRGGRLSPEILYLGISVVLAFVVVAGATVARSSGLPRFESTHLASVTYSARCSGARCAVELAATTVKGASAAIPSASTLTFGCGSDEPRVSVYVDGLGEPVPVPRGCADPRLVAAWPTVMGLPPGSFELAAVDVRNL
jgi:hypothetical protein